MFWPNRDFVLPEPYRHTTLWFDGPRYSTFLQLVRPALRALFLQGYRTRSIFTCAGCKDMQPAMGLVFDFETLEVNQTVSPHTPEHTGLDVVFEVSPLNDQWGPVTGSYGMADTPVKLGFDGELPTDGSVPQGLKQSIDAFVNAAVTRLRQQASQGSFPRANNQGLMWIFNPLYFQGLKEGAPLVPANHVYEHILQSPITVIPDLVFDRRRNDKLPSLSRLANETYGGVWAFWETIRDSLMLRGEMHLLNMITQQSLSGSDSQISWLDAILTLLGLGVIKMDGLVEVMQPQDPVTATVEEAAGGRPEHLILTVWQETKITISRETSTRSPTAQGGYVTGLEGCVSWEYVNKPGERPRMVIVASRGIKIDAPTYRKGYTPWVLDIYRVQQESLVPPTGSTIQTNTFLSAGPIRPREGETIISSNELLIARPKPDGLFLEFPATTPDQHRFKVDITLTNPCSGKDGFTVDAHYYNYEVADGVDPSGYRTGVHLCVWATAGVKLEASGAALITGSQYVSSYFGQVINYKASAESWTVPELKDIPFPFSTVQGISPAMAVESSRIHQDVERFQTGQAHFHAAGNRQINLTENRFYVPRDSGIYDVLDVAISLIPFVGDVVDLGEVAHAWSTGRDKWGRPVSNFDLAVMTFCAAVPLLSSSFYKGVKNGLPDGSEIVFRSTELRYLLEQARLNIFNPADAERALEVSSTWRYYLNTPQDPRRQEAVDSLIDFARQNANQIEQVSQAMAERAGETWLTLDDVFDSWSGSFRPAVLDADFQRWVSAGNPPDPMAYLRQLPEDTVQRALAETLLGTNPVNRGRFLPQRVRCPSDADRFPIGGPVVPVRDIDVTTIGSDGSTPFGRAVGEYVTEALSPASRIRVVMAGFLRSVRELAGDAEFIRQAVQALLRRYNPADRQSIIKILGNDVIGGNAGTQLSLRERAARFGSALFAAAAEMRANNLNPLDLLDPALLPQLQEFVRKFINREFEIGSRFELVKATSFFINLIRNRYSTVVEMGTQIPLPALEWMGETGVRIFLKGPDVVLVLNYMQGTFAMFVQFKAYHDLTRLASSSVEIVRDPVTRRLVCVEGAEFARQGVLDLLRAAQLDYQVPAPRLNIGTSYLPEEITNWIDLFNVHVFMFDAALARNHLIGLAWEASTRTQRTVIRADDLQGVDEAVCETFRVIFPNGLDFNLPEDEIVTFIDTQFAAWARQRQNWLNGIMESLDGDFGLPFRFLVVPSTVTEREIVDQALALRGQLEPS